MRTSIARSFTLAVLPIAAACAVLAASPEASAAEKAGPWMANFKIGPSFGVTRFFPTLFTLELDGGYAVVGDNAGYITFSPTFQVGSGTLITLPVGFEYDIPLPVENLFIAPKLSLGPTFSTSGGDPAFTLIPEVGAKYLLTDMFHVGFEPFSMPINISSTTVVQYRVLFYGGANF